MTDAAANPFPPGSVVAGKYRVDGVLGRGGMGVVIAATNVALDQRVALKFLLPEVASNLEVVARFIREARAAVKIHSEHVARVLDVGTLESGAPYTVMEYLEGQDLSQLIRDRGALPIADACDYALQACEALAEAHVLGIVHRDLKPANLYLARRPGGIATIKVLDFGISKIPASKGESVLTAASALMGSPSYMSPEQMMAAESVTTQSDIWSFGVTLYELLAGRLPFSATTAPELVAHILQKAHEPLRTYRQEVPPALEQVVHRCLEKDASRRFRDVAELAHALLPFAPPRCAQSVERVERVLGVTPPPAAPPMAQMPSDHSRTPIGVATFSPTSSGSTTTAKNKAILPLVLFGIATIAGVTGGGLVIHHQRAKKLAESASASASNVAPPSAVVTIAPPTPSTSPTPTESIAPDESAEPVASAKTQPSAIAPHLVPHASARPAASPSAPTPSPTCGTIASFDAAGVKHFKYVECPK